MHRHSRTRRLFALIMLLLLAAVGMFALWLNEDATPQDALLATATPVPEAVSYTVDAANSQVSLIVNSRLGDIEGSFEMGSGGIELLHEEDGWRVIVNLTFDARTLDIGNDQLNDVMHRALEVETYPNGIFVARSATLIPDGATATPVDLVGQMELHGTVRDYTIHATVTVADDTVTLAAQHVIDSRDFGISIPALFAESTLNANLYISARREPSTTK